MPIFFPPETLDLFLRTVGTALREQDKVNLPCMLRTFYFFFPKCVGDGFYLLDSCTLTQHFNLLNSTN